MAGEQAQTPTIGDRIITEAFDEMEGLRFWTLKKEVWNTVYEAIKTEVHRCNDGHMPLRFGHSMYSDTPEDEAIFRAEAKEITNKFFTEDLRLLANLIDQFIGDRVRFAGHRAFAEIHLRQCNAPECEAHQDIAARVDVGVEDS